MPQFDTHFFSSLIFWEIVSFAILLLILWKFAFPPIMAVLDERERKIRDSLDEAERNRAEAERKLKEYEAKLNAAAKDAEAILSQARERALRAAEENEQRMRADAERIKEDAAREIDHARRRAVAEIRTHTIDLALQVAEKVVGRSLTDADQRRLAEETLSAVAEHQKP
jgi:F-type H+-transporting ATPase subunit b